MVRVENETGSEGECMECGSSADLLMLALSDADSRVLDQQVICRACAQERGWQPGVGMGRSA